MSGYPFESVARAPRDNPARRAGPGADPKAAPAKKGGGMSGADRARLAVDTPETVHAISPPGNAALSESALERAVGGTRVWGPDGSFLGYTREMTPA